MERVLELARTLGEAIAASERYQALRKAEAAVEKDEEAVKLQKEYAEVAKRIHELEQAGKPLEPEDKRRAQTLKETLARNGNIQEVTRAWADYNEMIQKVNKSIFEKLGKEEA